MEGGDEMKRNHWKSTRSVFKQNEPKQTVGTLKTETTKDKDDDVRGRRSSKHEPLALKVTC